MADEEQREPLKFGDWQIIGFVNKDEVLCRCKCGTERKVLYYNLQRGVSKNCGCTRKSKTDDLIGQTFNEWTLIEKRPNRRVLCRCSCGTEKEQFTRNIINGASKSCGHERNFVSKKFGHWTIIEELGGGKVMCKCDCGTERELYKKAVVHGQTKSCGCSATENIVHDDLTGRQYGYWHVDSYAYTAKNRNTMWNCTCVCGKTSIVPRSALVSEASSSCGCRRWEKTSSKLMERYGETSTRRVHNPRENWQVEAVSSREAMFDCITNLKANGIHVTAQYLMDYLGLSPSSVLTRVHGYELDDMVDLSPQSSKCEDELADYVKSIINTKVITNTKSIIAPEELDIYIPEKNIAIEFNGSYWHSDVFKDRMYHYRKIEKCKEKGIRLIHIYEYEWSNNKDGIKAYIKNTLADNNVIYARNTEVKDIDSQECRDFLDKYHLQGKVNATVNIGLYFENELVSVMTFGTPRFDKDSQYELFRYCTKNDVSVVGGAQKMFSYFINKYKPNNIISYCDTGKFSGDIYEKLGFEFSKYSNPSYVWVNNSKVLSRYNTQKDKLISAGWGTEEDTEDSIMREHGYLKVYNSGNIKYTWLNKGSK